MKTLTNDQQANFQSYSSPVMQFINFRGRYKARLGSDRTQTLKFSYTYEPPFGKGKRFLPTANPVLRQIMDGWEVSGIQIYQSRTPLAIVTDQSIPSGLNP